MHQRTQLGKKGESFVAAALEKQGFTIEKRNYAKQYGEIDLIACKDDLLIFVEVKMRRSSYFDLSEVITRSKQKKIIMVAKEYLAQNQCDDKDCRFDVALLEEQAEEITMTYLPNAFCEEW